MTTSQLLSICVWLLVALVGVVAFFAKRLLKQNDDALATAAANNAAAVAANTVLSQQVEVLTSTLHTNSEETKKLHGQLGTLLRAFSALDKWIYGEVQHGTFKNPPPDFNAGAPL
jgi:HAMP domain-containing protein